MTCWTNGASTVNPLTTRGQPPIARGREPGRASRVAFEALHVDQCG